MRLVGAFACLLAVLLIAGATSLYFWRHPNGNSQFQYVFGGPPPAGVTDVIAYRRGGIPDTNIYLRFVADRAGLETTLSYRSFDAADHMVRDWFGPQKDSPALWRRVFGAYSDQISSMLGTPVRLATPSVYECLACDPEITVIKVLWNEETGQTFVLCLVG